MFEKFLHVDLIVPRARAAEFEDASRKFAKDGFDRLIPGVGYKLVLALKSQESFPYRAYGRFTKFHGAPLKSEARTEAYRNQLFHSSSSAYRYVNVWGIPKGRDADLTSLMEKASDDPAYLRVEAVVVREVQEFVRLVKRPEGLPTLNGGKLFERRVSRFKTHELIPYLFRSSMLFPVHETRGLHHLGQFQSVTGVLNSVTEFWQVSPKSRARSSLAASLGPGLSRELIDRMPTPIYEAREFFLLAPYFQRETTPSQ